jgi:hypothetical protein
MIESKKKSAKQNKIKRVPILLIIFGIWIFVFFSVPDAAQDPMSAFGVVKFNQGIIAPSFKMEDLAGNLVRLEDFRGRVVLLNFWTTW